jgi:hypothetical protein
MVSVMMQPGVPQTNYGGGVWVRHALGGAAWDYFRVWGGRIKIVRDAPADHRAGRRGPRDGLLRFIPLHLRSYLSHRPALLESETTLLADDDAKAVCRPGQARCLILPSALRDPVAWGQ